MGTQASLVSKECRATPDWTAYPGKRAASESRVPLAEQDSLETWARMEPQGPQVPPENVETSASQAFQGALASQAGGETQGRLETMASQASRETQVCLDDLGRLEIQDYREDQVSLAYLDRKAPGVGEVPMDCQGIVARPETQEKGV